MNFSIAFNLEPYLEFEDGKLTKDGCKMAILAVSTIREFGGRYKDNDIFFVNANNKEIPAFIKEELQKLNCIFIDEKPIWPNLPEKIDVRYLNKIYGYSLIEKKIPGNILYLDIDIVCRDLENFIRFMPKNKIILTEYSIEMEVFKKVTYFFKKMSKILNLNRTYNPLGCFYFSRNSNLFNLLKEETERLLKNDKFIQHCSTFMLSDEVVMASLLSQNKGIDFKFISSVKFSKYIYHYSDLQKLKYFLFSDHIYLSKQSYFLKEITKKLNIFV